MRNRINKKLKSDERGKKEIDRIVMNKRKKGLKFWRVERMLIEMKMDEVKKRRKDEMEEGMIEVGLLI